MNASTQTGTTVVYALISTVHDSTSISFGRSKNLVESHLPGVPVKATLKLDSSQSILQDLAHLARPHLTYTKPSALFEVVVNGCPDYATFKTLVTPKTTPSPPRRERSGWDHTRPMGAQP
jgi:hypothetical protein